MWDGKPITNGQAIHVTCGVPGVALIDGKMGSMAGHRARMAGFRAVKAMDFDDRGRTARRGAHLYGRSGFLVRPVSTGWGAALGGETALCIRVGA